MRAFMQPLRRCFGATTVSSPPVRAPSPHPRRPPPLLVLPRSEQQPLVEARLAAVGSQAGPLAAAAAGLQELAQTIEQEHAVSLAQPPLEEMEAVLDALLASMAEQLAQQGLSGVVRETGLSGLVTVGRLACI